MNDTINRTPAVLVVAPEIAIVTSLCVVVSGIFVNSMVAFTASQCSTSKLNMKLYSPLECDEFSLHSADWLTNAQTHPNTNKLIHI